MKILESRVHENDATGGVALDPGEFQHLNLPAEWDSGPLRVGKPVEMPTGRGGTPNMARYLEAVESDLASVNDQPAMAAWIAANEPIYLATDFPIATRIRAMKMATARRLLLGMPPSAYGEG